MREPRLQVKRATQLPQRKGGAHEGNYIRRGKRLRILEQIEASSVSDSAGKREVLAMVQAKREENSTSCPGDQKPLCVSRRASPRELTLMHSHGKLLVGLREIRVSRIAAPRIFGIAAHQQGQRSNHSYKVYFCHHGDPCAFRQPVTLCNPVAADFVGKTSRGVLNCKAGWPSGMCSQEFHMRSQPSIWTSLSSCLTT